MEVHGFNYTGSILATINGVNYTIPDNMGDRYRRMIAEWEAEGNTIPPYVPPAVDLAAYAADKSWRVETGGVDVGGVTVATDDRSKLLVFAARTRALGDPSTVKRWDVGAGETITVDAATLIAMGDAVDDFVTACFDRRADVYVAIAAGDVTTTEEIDAAFADVSTPWAPGV